MVGGSGGNRGSVTSSGDERLGRRHRSVRLGHHRRGERGGGAVLRGDHGLEEHGEVALVRGRRGPGGSTSGAPSGFRRTATLRAGRTGDGGLAAGRAWGTGVSLRLIVEFFLT